MTSCCCAAWRCGWGSADDRLGADDPVRYRILRRLGGDRAAGAVERAVRAARADRSRARLGLVSSLGDSRAAGNRNPHAGHAVGGARALRRQASIDVRNARARADARRAGAGDEGGARPNSDLGLGGAALRRHHRRSRRFGAGDAPDDARSARRARRGAIDRDLSRRHARSPRRATAAASRLCWPLSLARRSGGAGGAR